MIMQATELWNRVSSVIEQEISQISYNTWIMPLQAYGMNDQLLILLARNDFQRNYVENYRDLILNVIEQLIGSKPNLHIVVNEEEAGRLLETHPSSTSDSDTMDRLHTFASSQERMNPSMGAPDLSSKARRLFNPYYTFDNFVVGPSNELAYATCVAVAQNQGEMQYNPLFLYGDSGLGKTHLMHAIGNYIEQNQPSRDVLYVQTEQFVNEFVTTIKDNRYDSFRNKYRNTDVLLIDDIQFIEGKPQMQIEFFHTFNALYERGSFIIMTCDKSPHNLAHLEDRLKTRFASGWFPEVLQPDYEMRKAILKKRAQYNKKDIPEEILDYIATNVTSNIRELEGAYNTVTAYALLAGELSLDNAQIALKNAVDSRQAKQITSDLIIDVTSAYYHIHTRDLLSSKRSKDVTEPRQLAMYLCRNELDLPFKQIGEAFGGRDHSTVMHACSKIEQEIENANATLLADLDAIKKRISNPE